MQNNSTLVTILQMTIVYFIVFMPFPLIWTFRNTIGFLLDVLTVRDKYSYVLFCSYIVHKGLPLLNTNLYQVDLLIVIERSWINVSLLIHTWNFWFYMSRMAIFRKEFLVLTHLLWLERLLCHRRSTDNSISGLGSEATGNY